MKPQKQALLFFYSLAFFLIAIVLCSFFKLYRQHQIFTKRYKINNVTIIQNEIDHEISKTSKHNTAKHEYLTKIVFEYEIDNTAYRSDHFHAGGLKSVFSDKRKAQELSAKYPIGTKTHAYYHPDFPQKAFLNSKFNFSYCWYILLFSTGAYFIMWFCFFVEQEMGTIIGFFRRIILIAWWFSVGFFCFGYYFKHSESISLWGVCISVLYAALGVLWIYFLSLTIMLPAAKETEDVYDQYK
ncbi:MAG: DUF3592 domain-containing protein [Planctomycetota bacterium]|jgi:hypothetical protein